MVNSDGCSRLSGTFARLDLGVFLPKLIKLAGVYGQGFDTLKLVTVLLFISMMLAADRR